MRNICNWGAMELHKTLITCLFTMCCVCVCVCAFVCMFVCLCMFVPVLCHSIPSHFGELERPRPRHGTKRRWWDLVAADVQAVGLGVAWYGVAQDGKEWEEVCRQCCAYDINKDIGHCAANSSNTNVDASFPCSCGCSFRCPGDLTRHRQICDGAQHHTKATEKWPTHLTAGVEELSTGKETVQDIPTSAPTVPSDLLQINIQGIVPQDTAIRVCVCVCVSNYVELPEVYC